MALVEVRPSLSRPPDLTLSLSIVNTAVVACITRGPIVKVSVLSMLLIRDRRNPELTSHSPTVCPWNRPTPCRMFDDDVGLFFCLCRHGSSR